MNLEEIIYNKILENSSILINRLEMGFNDLSPAGKASAINLSAAISFSLLFSDNNFRNFKVDKLYQDLANEIEKRKKKGLDENQYLLQEKIFKDYLNESNNNFNEIKLNAENVNSEIEALKKEHEIYLALSLSALQNSEKSNFFVYNCFINLYVYPFLNTNINSEELLSNLKSKLNSDKNFLNIKENFSNLIENIIGEIYNNHTINDDICLNAMKAFKENAKNVVKTETNQNNKNCYVATLVYKDINHPNVEFFRNIRDERLNKNYFGRKFIKYYYKISPNLVLKLEPYKTLQNSIKYILDKLILILKYLK